MFRRADQLIEGERDGLCTEWLVAEEGEGDLVAFGPDEEFDLRSRSPRLLLDSANDGKLLFREPDCWTGNLLLLVLLVTLLLLPALLLLLVLLLLGVLLLLLAVGGAAWSETEEDDRDEQLEERDALDAFGGEVMFFLESLRLDDGLWTLTPTGLRILLFSDDNDAVEPLRDVEAAGLADEDFLACRFTRR